MSKSPPPANFAFWNDAAPQKRRCRYCGSRECPNHDHCRDKGPDRRIDDLTEAAKKAADDIRAFGEAVK